MSSIFILTNFIGWDEAYSLCHVVRNQAVMLIQAGHKVTVGVCRAFDPLSWPWSALTPEFVRFDYMPKHDEWKDMPSLFERSNGLAELMRQVLKDEDLIITHDLLFQPDSMMWNVAIRKVIEHDESKRWLHWFHSPTPLWCLIDDKVVLDYCLSWPKRSWLVFPNHSDLKRVGDRYQCPTNKRVVVHHAFDFDDHYFHGDVVGQRFNEAVRFDRYDCVLLDVARLDRGKQVEFGVEIAAALERLSVSSALFVVDFHSLGDEKGEYREELKELTLQRGCEIFFSSELMHEGHNVPHSTVKNLMRVADILVNASRSESYSLVVQEALLDGTLPVLNANYPAMRELWGTGALFAEFGSDINTDTMGDGQTLVKYDDAFDFADLVAGQVWQYLCLPTIAGRVTIRKTRTLEAVYEQELGPLIGKVRGLI